VATLALFVVALAYVYFTHLRFHPKELMLLSGVAERNAGGLWVSLCALTINFTFLGIYLKRSIGLERQGSRLAALEGKRKRFRFGRKELVSFTFGVSMYFCALMALRSSVSPSLGGLISKEYLELFEMLISGNLGVFCGLVSQMILGVAGHIRIAAFDVHKLDLPETNNGDLVLGTTPGEITHEGKTEDESWVSIPSRGLNGGVFISGSVGSGKTQGTILRYLSQIVSAGAAAPAILAIDPKRTFLAEGEEIIKKAGLSDRIVRISLKGNQSFNPVYIASPLKDSRFVDLAEMVRSAAVNFMGKSSDSPFWDVSSSHLIRNTIAYCAAKHGYFTLIDLYRAIVLASKEDLGADLKECVLKGNFTEEEKL